MNNVSLPDWLDYQQRTLYTIIKNVLLVPLYLNPEKFNDLLDLLGSVHVRQLGKDIKAMDLKDLATKWSSLVLTALERKLEKHQ
ncbi:MAG: hypothetical protein WAV56_00790 [Microgenomates group bacterium]